MPDEKTAREKYEERFVEEDVSVDFKPIQEGTVSEEEQERRRAAIRKVFGDR